MKSTRHQGSFEHPTDLFQLLLYHIALSIRLQKLTDKINVITLLFLKVFYLIFIAAPSVSASIEKKMLNIVNCKGAIIKVNGVSYCLRDYESFMIVGANFERWIWEYLRPQGGDTFVDIGAHVGKYALQVAKQIGDKGRVIAVEANPENFEALTKGIYINGLKNVSPLNLAAWNKVEKQRLYNTISSGRGSVKFNDHLGCSEVDAMPLDNLLKETKIDWIKIDVEGAELEALEGLKHTLEKYHPKVIAEIFKSNTNSAISFMEKRGYTANIIYTGTTGNHILFSVTAGSSNKTNKG